MLPTTSQDAQICPICLDTTEGVKKEELVSQEAKVCKCNSTYHLQCWQAWKGRCPTCRFLNPVTETEIQGNPLTRDETVVINILETSSPTEPPGRIQYPVLVTFLIWFAILLARLVACLLILMVTGYLGLSAQDGKFINLLPLGGASRHTISAICITLMFWGLLYIVCLIVVGLVAYVLFSYLKKIWIWLRGCRTTPHTHTPSRS